MIIATVCHLRCVTPLCTIISHHQFLTSLLRFQGQMATENENVDGVDSNVDVSTGKYGTFDLIQSKEKPDIKFLKVSQITPSIDGNKVKLLQHLQSFLTRFLPTFFQFSELF